MRFAGFALAAALAVAGAAGAQAPAGGAPQAPTGPPQVLGTSPQPGALVSPSTSTLSVTFDRPMMAAWSFAGRPQDAPEYVGQPTLSADRRTISVPIRLRPGASYVVWLNSESYKSFKDERGQAALPFRLTFSTAGN